MDYVTVDGIRYELVTHIYRQGGDGSLSPTTGGEPYFRALASGPDNVPYEVLWDAKPNWREFDKEDDMIDLDAPPTVRPAL